MIDQRSFEEKIAEFSSGLSEAQLAGNAPFNPDAKAESLGWKRSASFASGAGSALDANDKALPLGDTEAMNNISRSELDTKLQLIEERLDRKVSDIATSVADLKSSNQQTVRALNNSKFWAIGTAIAVLAIFLSTLQWGLSAQKEENARFSSYIREDVKSISDDMKDVAKTLTEIRVKLEPSSGSK